MIYRTTCMILLSLALVGCANNDKAYEDQTKLYNEIRTTNNPSSMFRIAESMRKSGNFETATNLYQQVLQIEPDRTEAYIGLSQCLRNTGRSEAALEILKTIPKGKENLSYYKEVGAIYTTRQDPKACINAYKKAYQIDQKDLAALNGLAVCHDIANQHDEAQKWYHEAINLAPAHEKLRSNLGLSLALSGKAPEAISVLKNVVSSKDATQKDRQNLAIAYGLAGDMDSAAKMFSQDLDENDVRTNIAFVSKLAKSQQNMARRLTTQQLKDAFESALGQEVAAPAVENAAEKKEVAAARETVSEPSNAEEPVVVKAPKAEQVAAPKPQETKQTSTSTLSAKESFMKNFATNEFAGPKALTVEATDREAVKPGTNAKDTVAKTEALEEKIVEKVADNVHTPVEGKVDFESPQAYVETHADKQNSPADTKSLY